MLGEHCVFNNTNKAATEVLIYAGLSSLSLLFLVPTVLITIFIYLKRRVVIEHMEGLFMTLSVILLSLTLNESFQWVLFCSSIGCEVVGFVREYCLVALLSNILCIGFHLLLQMCQPKCFQVIDEVRRKRFRKLAVVYLLFVILVPLLFVFWPFLTWAKYGKDGTFCWISDTAIDPWYVKLVLWHIWALLICLFTLLVSLLVIARLFLRAAKCNADVCTLLLLMLMFLYSVITFGLAAWLKVTYLGSVGAIAFVIGSIVLLSRTCYNICYKRHYGPHAFKINKSAYQATHSTAAPLIDTPISTE